jgi:outer membrane protein
MNKGLLVFNVILLVLVGVLFYLHFSSKQGVANVANTKSDNASAPFRIAYFEMDSVTNNFSVVKEVKAELSKKEQDMTNDLARMEKSLMNKAKEYQSQPLSQVQSEVATNDMRERQRQYEVQKGKYDQEYQDLYMSKMVEVRTKIEDYLKEYNKAKGYTYIFSYEPTFIYYRDTTYNITADLLKGLSDKYPSTPKK